VLERHPVSVVQSRVVLRLQGRLLPQPFLLNGVQARLLVAGLAAAGAGDLDLLVPGGYVPSAVAQSWSAALFEAAPELVLVEEWNVRRAQLQPLGVRRVSPVAAVSGRHPRRGPVAPDPFAGLPPLAEHTPVLQTPLGPLLQSFAVWAGTCGGFAVG